MEDVGEILKPALAPRDLKDVLICLSCAMVQLGVLCGLPAALVFAVSANTGIASAAAIFSYLLFASFSVRNLVVQADGIVFERLLGSPRRLPWGKIGSVQKAPRSEVVFHGWLWPMFPAREMTPSFTSLGHYRICYGTKWVYFPPSDPAVFERAMARNGVAVV